MRTIGFIIMASAALAQAPAPTPPPYQAVGTMSQLMINIIYPTSDAIFYIDRAVPKTDVEWGALANQALMLGEAGNLLMMPGRARDQGEWMKDAKMLVDAGAAAFRAARAKDVEALRNLNDQLYAACVVCHEMYRPNYGRRILPGRDTKQ